MDEMDQTTDQVDPLGKGPFLLAALLCERVLVEQDGVKSAFRIIDRITQAKVGVDPPEEMPAFSASLYLLVKLKAGAWRGNHYLKVSLTTPSGQTHSPLTQSLSFGGDPDQGIDFVGTIQVHFEQTGIYWFDIELNDVRLTRIPLRIVYHRQVQQADDPSGMTVQ